MQQGRWLYYLSSKNMELSVMHCIAQKALEFLLAKIVMDNTTKVQPA